MDHPDDEDEGENIPLSDKHTVKVQVRIKGVKNKENDALEKCIENEYRKSIITHYRSSKKSRTGWRKHIGVFSAFMAGFVTSVNLLIIRYVTNNYHYNPLTLSFWRYVGSLPFTLTMLVYFIFRERGKLFETVWPVKGKEKWLTHIMLSLNGILFWIFVSLRYYSLEYLTLADSSVITYASPVVVVILAHFFLREKCGVVSILVSLVAVIGAAVIARPPLLTGKEEFDTGILIGLALATGGMLCQSFTSIVVRKIRQVPFSITILVHGLYGSVASTVLGSCLGILEMPRDKLDTLFALGVIASAFMLQIFLILAYKFEEAARVTLIMCLEIVLAFVWQYLFFDIIPDIFSVIGSLILISTVAVTLMRKWVEGLPENSKARMWCCILLK